MALLKDRLLEALEDEKMRPAALARVVGVSRATVHAWLSGQTQQLKGDNLTRAARALRVTPAWLAEGKQPKRVGAPLATVPTAPRAIPTDTPGLQEAITEFQRKLGVPPIDTEALEIVIDILEHERSQQPSKHLTPSQVAAWILAAYQEALTGKDAARDASTEMLRELLRGRNVKNDKRDD